MRINLGEDEQPEIGLIALIDCIFFLLMFFMVATSFKQQTDEKKEKTLPIVLPAASASLQSDAKDKALVIGVDKSGSYFLSGSKISIEKLHDQLRKEFAANPARRIRVDGDAMTPYQNIVRVLDLCQFEGLTNISMHTRN